MSVLEWQQTPTRFFFLYEQHVFSRIHPFNLNPNEICNPSALAAFFSSSQTLMTASQSHVKMEALASTRLIHSSAFACPAMEETRVRKVRVRKMHIYTDEELITPRYVEAIILHSFFILNVTGLCSTYKFSTLLCVQPHLFPVI